MLSDMQRNIQKQIESATNEETKLRPKIYQNRIMTEIHRESEEEENVKVRTFIKPLTDNQIKIRECMEQLKTFTK